MTTKNNEISRYFEKHEPIWGRFQKILLKYIQIILLDHSLPQKVKLTEGPQPYLGPDMHYTREDTVEDSELPSFH